MIFEPLEILNLVILSVVVALIFTPDFTNPQLLEKYIIYSFLSVGLHEIFHKLVAMAFGYQTFLAVNIFGLLIGLILKLANFPIIFFVPAMVEISGRISPLSYALIAVAGPMANLLVAVTAKYILKDYELFYLNFALFVINMLPIPGFDGYKFLLGLLNAV